MEKICGLQIFSISFLKQKIVYFLSDPDFTFCDFDIVSGNDLLIEPVYYFIKLRSILLFLRKPYLGFKAVCKL